MAAALSSVYQMIWEQSVGAWEQCGGHQLSGSHWTLQARASRVSRLQDINWATAASDSEGRTWQRGALVRTVQSSGLIRQLFCRMFFFRKHFSPKRTTPIILKGNHHADSRNLFCVHAKPSVRPLTWNPAPCSCNRDCGRCHTSSSLPPPPSAVILIHVDIWDINQTK